MYDIKDARGVPVSAGVPRIVVFAGIIGVILIFAVASCVIFSSRYGHVWPSSDSTHIKL
jgi:hypothetical protein